MKTQRKVYLISKYNSLPIEITMNDADENGNFKFNPMHYKIIFIDEQIKGE
jgi:hypothetical protein